MLSTLISVSSKPSILMSFSKLVIKLFNDFLFREIIVISDNFKSIRPCITDLAAPPDPRTIDVFFIKLRFFKG